MVKKMFIEIRLCNLTHAFKGNVKFAKIYMVKFKSAVTDMRYFARSKFSRSLVPKLDMTSGFQVRIHIL